VRRIKEKTQDLSVFNKVEVNASLAALLMNPKKDPIIHDNIVAAEGSRGLASSPD
jgi:hypothetical protein